MSTSRLTWIARQVRMVDMATSRIEPIHIPDHIRPLIGNADTGTHVYRRSGLRDEFESWFDAIWEACGPDGAISPGAAGIYAQVSRAGVHKRMREGGLTAFLFHLDRGNGADSANAQRSDTGRPYTFIPVRECRAWAELLKARRGGERHRRESTEPKSRISQPDGDSWRQW
jgi:hypothetical protein